jgi:hypothetical protein
MAGRKYAETEIKKVVVAQTEGEVYTRRAAAEKEAGKNGDNERSEFSVIRTRWCKVNANLMRT